MGVEGQVIFKNLDIKSFNFFEPKFIIWILYGRLWWKDGRGRG